MKVALSFWGTQKYLNFLPQWYDSLEKNFLIDVDKTYFVLTDGEIDDIPDNMVLLKIPNYGFPTTFYKTFEELLKIKEYVDGYDWLLSVDADMIAYDKISYVDFFDDSKKYIGVHHPCHYLNMPPHDKFPGSFETNPKSKAFVTEDMDLSAYYQGCLWGGKIPYIFDMMKELDRWTKEDLNNDISPIWYEESYFNKFFILNKSEVHTLSPEFAYPEVYSQGCPFNPKLVHLAKDNSKYHV